MKKWIGVLGLLLVLTGCAQSEKTEEVANNKWELSEFYDRLAKNLQFVFAGR